MGFYPTYYRDAVAIELFVEIIGLAGANYRPILNLVRMIGK